MKAGSSKHNTSKIQTFNASNFWKNAYSGQRGKLLQLVDVTAPDQIVALVNKKYEDLPVELRYDIETRIKRSQVE